MYTWKHFSASFWGVSVLEFGLDSLRSWLCPSRYSRAHPPGLPCNDDPWGAPGRGLAAVTHFWRWKRSKSKPSQTQLEPLNQMDQWFSYLYSLHSAYSAPSPQLVLQLNGSCLHPRWIGSRKLGWRFPAIVSRSGAIWNIWKLEIRVTQLCICRISSLPNLPNLYHAFLKISTGRLIQPWCAMILCEPAAKCWYNMVQPYIM